MRGLRAGAVFAIAAAVVGIGGLSWACTVQARIVAVTPESGAERSTLTVRGEGLGSSADGTPTPVEIRWNGIRGAVLATATVDNAGRFSTVAEVPPAAPGVYSLVAVAKGVGIGRIAFEVTGSSASGAPALAASGATQDRLWATSPAGSAGNGPPIGVAVGAALFGLGIVGLFSGFTVVALRRRRAAATA